MLLIRGLMGLGCLGLLLQAECGTFLTLSGCFPKAGPLIAAIAASTPASSGPITLEPTTKTTTTGIFLAVENNTSYNVGVDFVGDGQTFIANVAVGQTQRYELAPPESAGVTVLTVDLNGSWADTTSDQTLTFANGALTEFVDEDGTTHVFDAADYDPGQNVLSTQKPIQRSVPDNTVQIEIATQDPSDPLTSESRTWLLMPASTGITLVGSSTVVQVDASGTPVAGAEEVLTHTFFKRFPNTLQAVREQDSDPATGQLVQEFTYDPPPVELRAGIDYEFGQTVTFRINQTTVSFVVSGP